MQEKYYQILERKDSRKLAEYLSVSDLIFWHSYAARC